MMPKDLERDLYRRAVRIVADARRRDPGSGVEVDLADETAGLSIRIAIEPRGRSVGRGPAGEIELDPQTDPGDLERRLLAAAVVATPQLARAIEALIRFDASAAAATDRALVRSQAARMIRTVESYLAGLPIPDDGQRGREEVAE